VMFRNIVGLWIVWVLLGEWELEEEEELVKIPIFAFMFCHDGSHWGDSVGLFESG